MTDASAEASLAADAEASESPSDTGLDDVADAACPVGTADAHPAASARSPRRRSLVRIVAASIAALVLIAAVALVAYSSGARAATAATPPTPTDASADAGFARDMQVHHMQGVELAMIVRDETSDEDVRRLAYDMATTQAQQSGQMYAWLEEWGLSQLGTAAPMAWTTLPVRGEKTGAHDHGADASGGAASADSTMPDGMDMGDPAAMPGYATPEQVQSLRDATGVDAERIFLQLMIAHHRGGVEMAAAADARAQSKVVRTLAEAIIASQTGEIALMEEMLTARS